MRHTLNSRLISGLFAVLVVCVASSAYPQPNYFFVKTLVGDEDEPRTEIMSLDLTTGAVSTAVTNAGHILQLLPNGDGSLLFVLTRVGLDVVDFRKGGLRRTILNGIEWVHSIDEMPEENRIYISVGTSESYDCSIIVGADILDSLGTIKNLMSFHPPLFSRNGKKFFRFVPDPNSILFDVYNSTTGVRISSKTRCGDYGPFAYHAGFSAGRNGLAVVRTRFEKKDNWRTQNYVLCDPESHRINWTIPFPWRSDVTISADMKSVVIEKTAVNRLQNSSEGERLNLGDIYIFDTAGGHLTHRLSLPTNGKTLTFVDFPGMLYYLLPGEPRAIIVDLHKITPTGELLDTLVSLKHQSVTNHWLGDEQFVRELDNELANAQKHLARSDSVNCRKELEIFQQKLKHEFERKADKGEKRFVTEEGYALLYFNALYLIERLPERR